MTKAQYTRQELNRLQLGWMIREQPSDQADSQGSTAATQKRKLQRGHRQQRREMMQDLGFE